MRFQDEIHEKRYLDLLTKMKGKDSYHRSVAYLMALAELPANDVFDFEKDGIKHTGLNKPWQTSSSRKATRLMFNLWNGCVRDSADPEADVSSKYAVDEIFSNAEYAPYFWEAIKIRFEME